MHGNLLPLQSHLGIIEFCERANWAKKRSYLECVRKISRTMWTHVTDKGTNNKQIHWRTMQMSFREYLIPFTCYFNQNAITEKMEKTKTIQKKNQNERNTIRLKWFRRKCSTHLRKARMRRINKDFHYMIHVTISRALIELSQCPQRVHCTRRTHIFILRHTFFHYIQNQLY